MELLLLLARAEFRICWTDSRSKEEIASRRTKYVTKRWISDQDFAVLESGGI